MYLSPSQHHRKLMAQTVPALRYEGGDVRAWQRRLRAKLRHLVGDMPAQKCPLRPRTLWRRDHPLGRLEKVVFTAEPFADVVAYVGLPQNSQPPYRFVICLQGHTTGMHKSIGVQFGDEAKPMEIDGDRDFALGCMQRGLAALCIEQRCFGERREQKLKKPATHGCHDATMHALMLGRTMIGERVYDVDRAIDYLEWRGDANPRCIGIMGNSGGGTISMFAAALLPRIAFAMPSCSFCTFSDSIMSVYHCADNYLPGILKYAEMSDVMGLFAPKPVVLVAGRKDHLFPFAATVRAFTALHRIYRAASAPRRCHLVAGREGHRFYARQAWPVLLKELENL